MDLGCGLLYIRIARCLGGILLNLLKTLFNRNFTTDFDNHKDYQYFRLSSVILNISEKIQTATTTVSVV